MRRPEAEEVKYLLKILNVIGLHPWNVDMLKQCKVLLHSTWSNKIKNCQIWTIRAMFPMLAVPL